MSQVKTKRTLRSMLGQLIILGMVCGLLFLLLYPACQQVRDASHSMLRSNNLRAIAVAIHEAHAKKVSLSQAICRPNGRPLLSWRVAILPYLDDADANALYKQFKLDEPWDSPHNYTLLNKMPSVYSSSGRDLPAHHTLMKVLVTAPSYAKGKYRPIWPATGPAPLVNVFAGLADPSSSTILVAELGSPVPWTKPEDIVIDESIEDDKVPLDFRCPGVRQSLPSFHAAMADASVRSVRLSNNTGKTSKQLIRPLIGYRDGETVDDSVID